MSRSPAFSIDFSKLILEYQQCYEISRDVKYLKKIASHFTGNENPKETWFDILYDKNSKTYSKVDASVMGGTLFEYLQRLEEDIKFYDSEYELPKLQVGKFGTDECMSVDALKAKRKKEAGGNMAATVVAIIASVIAGGLILYAILQAMD